MRQTMTQHDAVLSTVTQVATEQHDMTHVDPGQNVTNRVSQVCQLESVLTKHSAQQNGHIMTLQLPDRNRMRVWLPASDQVSLPATESMLYVETDSLQRSLKGNTKSSVTLHSLRLLRYWQPVESDYSLRYLQTLFGKTPQPQVFLRLLALINRLQNKRLKQLLTDLFGQIDIAKPFVTLPASYNHHHSIPGGLLLHSVECAEWLEQIAHKTLPKAEAELTIIAALLHDLGKIETMSHPNSGLLVSHEVLSLTLLEPFLCQMQSNWKQGANALRQMLSWPMDGLKFPKLPGLVLVKMADQYSTALSARNMAFAGQPNFFYWAKLKTSTSDQFFNRIL